MARWQKWFPGWDGAADFSRRSIRGDVIAGLVLSAVLVPAGMAYAQAAGLPPVAGLYATVVPLLVYAVVGPSRVLVLGPDSTLAPLVAATVLPLAAGDPGRATSLAAALAIVGGVMCVCAGFARFGFVTELLSLPVRYGYLNGIAVSVVVSQVPTLLGFSTGADHVVTGVVRFAEGLAEGRAGLEATLVGLSVLAVVLGVRRYAPRFPGVIVATAGAMAAVALFGLRSRGVATVGAVPSGLPTFRWPDLRRSDLGPLVAGGFGIAMVAFADTSVLSRAYATHSGRSVEPDRELIALGLTNAATGLFRGFPVSASQSRTPVAEAAGARTQLAGVTGAVVTIAILVAAPGAFRNLPTAALAAVVISAVVGLVEVRKVLDLRRSRRSEFALAMAAFLAVVLTGAVRGVVIAVAASLAVFVAKAWRPHSAVLVRVERLKGYHDAERHPEGRQIPGLVLFRFDAPLFFANAELFRTRVLAAAARPGTAGVPVRSVVVTAEPITDIDATAAAMLDELESELADRGVQLGFAELKGHVREQLERLWGRGPHGMPPMHRTIGEAVRAHVTSHAVAWEDWEDRSP